MAKSYHEHCQEERKEALQALEKAKEIEKNNISISYLVPPSRKVIISVNPKKLNKTLKKLKKSGYRNIEVSQ